MQKDGQNRIGNPQQTRRSGTPGPGNPSIAMCAKRHPQFTPENRFLHIPARDR
jgi:hypothetical protein